MSATDETIDETDVRPMPRRVFLGLLGVGAAFVVGGSSVEGLLGSSVVGSALGVGGYQIYTVSAGFPTISRKAYRLKVDGDVAHRLELSLADLASLGYSEVEATFHCVTGWEVRNQRFGGVPLGRVLSHAGIDTSGGFVNFGSFDGVYSESLSMHDARARGTMIVTHLNGAPLSVAHGAPVRLFVKGMYGYKSIKWLNSISVSKRPVTGYWEQYGYPADAQIT